MSSYRLVIAPRARRQMRVIDDWWRQNRPAVPDLFSRELEAAIDRLRIMPTLGTRHQPAEGADTRKLLLPRCRYHVYYDLDESRLELQVVAVWHTARGSGPPLG